MARRAPNLTYFPGAERDSVPSRKREVREIDLVWAKIDVVRAVLEASNDYSSVVYPAGVPVCARKSVGCPIESSSDRTSNLPCCAGRDSLSGQSSGQLLFSVDS